MSDTFWCNCPVGSVHPTYFYNKSVLICVNLCPIFDINIHWLPFFIILCKINIILPKLTLPFIELCTATLSFWSILCKEMLSGTHQYPGYIPVLVANVPWQLISDHGFLLLWGVSGYSHGKRLVIYDILNSFLLTRWIVKQRCRVWFCLGLRFFGNIHLTRFVI